ncbi:MAG: hypothetical protein PHR45_06125 [Muribaculaceae bacterium]|nr:hypothetical protein [Muribaculaceae bacterium]
MINGSVEISNVRTYGICQFCQCVGTTFEDGRVIKNCIFGGMAEYKYNNNISDRYADSINNEIYAFDMQGLGDGLIFTGNHVSDYNDNIKAFRLISNNGGVVSGNILNSDALVEKSKGVLFTGNHLEYGSQLSIRNATVTASNNFFWRGKSPAIQVSRSYWPVTHQSSAVTLEIGGYPWTENKPELLQL